MSNKGAMFICTFLVLFFAFTAHAGDENQTITLADSKKIADAVALNEAIDRVSTRVMECIEKKLVPQDKCFCLYPTEIHNFKKKYETALKNNPEWRNKNVSWTIKGNPMGYSLSFPGLRRQVEMKCGQ